MAPVAAVAPATTGNSTVAKAVMRSMAVHPSPNREDMSATAATVTARAPARDTTGISFPPPASYTVWASPHSRRMTKRMVAERTPARTMPNISPFPVSTRPWSPSSRLSP